MRKKAYLVASLDSVAVQHGRAQIIHKYGEFLVIGRSVGEALPVYNVRFDELVHLQDVRGARKVQPLHNIQVGIFEIEKNMSRNSMF
jgi:hypothetical protein